MKPELTVTNMFAAASFQFVKSVGKNTLHPVPSIDEKDNVTPFQLVIKSTKRKFIFFEKAIYSPTEFQLTDVMVDCEPFKTSPVTRDFMSEYNRTTKLSLKGQFGADICKEIVDAELEASDNVEIDIKFGKVSKLEIKEPELLDELSKRNINMDHPYIRQIRENPKKVLCVITGVVVLPEGGTIHRITEFDTNESLKLKLIKGADASTHTQYSKDRDFGLAPGTAVAYNVHELNVDKKTGAVQLVLAKGSHGGFKDCIGYDEPDATCITSSEAGYQHSKQLEADLQLPEVVFRPFIDLSETERSRLNSWLLKLMSIPRDMVVLSDLLDEAESGQQIKVKLEEIQSKFLSTDDAWLEILKFVGFQINDGLLDHSSKKSALMRSVAEFFDAATVLDDDTLDLLRECPPELSEPMLKLLHDGIQGKCVQDQNIIKQLKENSTCQKILLDQQFAIEDNAIQAPIELPYTIDEVYWVIYALYRK